MATSPGRFPSLAPKARRAFQRALLGWFATHGRALPWREATDPYRILVSELMLQQTQVDRVVPKYLEFIARYPDFRSLAEASVEEVVSRWYPLGYNRRPIRLHAIAEAVVQNGGSLPREEAALRAFRGIGPYTAGAIRSFAFGEDAAVVDTNIRRVLGRIFVGADKARWPSVTRLYPLAGALSPPGQAARFNAALMDLGATVCLARGPRCDLCPLQCACVAAAHFSDAGKGLGRRDAARRRASRRAAARAPRARAWRSIRRRDTP